MVEDVTSGQWILLAFAVTAAICLGFFVALVLVGRRGAATALARSIPDCSAAAGRIGIAARFARPAHCTSGSGYAACLRRCVIDVAYHAEPQRWTPATSSTVSPVARKYAPGGAYIQPFTLWNTAAHRAPGLNPLCVPVSVVTAASSGRLPNLAGRLLRVEIEDLGAEVRPCVEVVRTFVGPRPSCVW
jgi:hypothetical protein